MHQISCEDCGQSSPAYDIVHFGSMKGGYKQICSRCFNTAVAHLSGVTNFEHVRFDPISMTDARGGTHEFHFRAHLFGAGVALDAFELREGHPAGYQFQVAGEPHDDLLVLLGRLVEKMQRALAAVYLEDGEHGPGINDGLVVRGRVEADLDADDRLPVMVVDGREVSWLEFGRMVAAFEGWQFRMEFCDLSKEV